MMKKEHARREEIYKKEIKIGPQTLRTWTRMGSDVRDRVRVSGEKLPSGVGPARRIFIGVFLLTVYTSSPAFGLMSR